MKRVNDINNQKEINSKASNKDAPEWVEMILDLRNGAGYTYTDIATYLKVSPAAIQRIATGKRHEPKFRISIALLKLYYEVFYGANAKSDAAIYMKLKSKNRLKWFS